MDDKTRMMSLLKRFGRNVHGFLALEPGLEYCFSNEGDAAIAYLQCGGCRVCVGGPVCAQERVAEVAQEFQERANRDGQTLVFFGVSQRFFGLPGTEGFDRLKIGEQPIWDPHTWRAWLKRHQKLRNQLSRSRREGTKIVCRQTHQLNRDEVEHLVAQWQDTHLLPPMGFMVQVELYEEGEERLYLEARKAGRLIGLAAAVPIFAMQGWLLEDLIVDRALGRGVSEALIDAFMTESVARGAEFVSLGMVPLAGLAGDDFRCHPCLGLLLQACKRFLRPLYNFDGLQRFRRKLGPTRWESVYLSTPGRLDFWTLRAVLMAFAGGWVPSYGWRAFKRATCPHGRSCCC